jgi:hypothetical protein
MIKNMNKFAVLVGIAAAVIISGALGAYAVFESNAEISLSQDAEEIVSGIKEDVSNAELGYGQVEKQNGAYSP